MKFSITWLKDHLETNASVVEITDALNRIGLEVEGVEDPSKQLAGFKVAKVLTAVKHPNADKLKLLSVDIGDKEPLQVVCGAPNARAGIKGVLGLPGATVPSSGMELKKSEIRGVESFGMMCSLSELGLGEDHDGIIELPEDATVGYDFSDYHGSSPVIDVAITPNRPDCMGVFGIARDLAAAGIGELKPISVPDFDISEACPIDIKIQDSDGCAAFYGRVIKGVKNGPSPDWLQQRLKSAGQRPISLVVDLTNYLMLAFGRPAHVYDLDKLVGPITARKAFEGEQFLALNERTYTLDPSITVIADEEGVHDIAGIMGGQHSGAKDETTNILLEIAYFNPAKIGVTGRKLGLASDARTRFERGVDPAFLDQGLDLLTGLITSLGGGRVSKKVCAGSPPDRHKVVHFDPELTSAIGGISIDQSEQRQILESLGFLVDSKWKVTCPLRRHDIEGAADLVEEIVRISGIDKVLSVPLPRQEGVAKPNTDRLQLLERKLRRVAAAAGMNEAITWSFISDQQASLFDGAFWMLENPISEEMKVMRPSLLPGLLAAVARNLDRGATTLRLFEIGRTYRKNGEYPVLSCILAGEKLPRGWATGKSSNFDAFDAKAITQTLLSSAGVPVGKLQVSDGAGSFYHPGQSATLRLGSKNTLASFGMLHPKILKHFGIDQPVVAATLNLGEIPEKRDKTFARPPFTPSNLQEVKRDFAFFVPEELAAKELLRAIVGADKNHIVDAGVFDVFSGQGVPIGKKSVAVEVFLQPKGKSFNESDLKTISDAIIANAAKKGAELRS